MSWYRSPLSPDQIAAGELPRRQEAFSAAFKAAGAPRMMALFQQECDDGACELYLTPDCGAFASELLQAWDASPCERPPLPGLQLLIGHNEITYYLP
ncbi:MAG: hypothetical protein C0621_04665 [Desulfuromonas sp.]|nr:MAG: hypothetical protein C0621_04665 [Desulfuromonas sp.]